MVLHGHVAHLRPDHVVGLDRLHQVLVGGGGLVDVGGEPVHVGEERDAGDLLAVGQAELGLVDLALGSRDLDPVGRAGLHRLLDPAAATL
jgi:hypothetical protein